MTVLVDHQIKSLCEQGLVKPYDESLINPSSLDIRLGNNLIIDNEITDISHHTKENPYILEPNEFVLVETLEYCDG